MIIAIVPAYNEEEKIESVVTALLPVVDRVVVVDDASEDKTATIAAAAGATVLTHCINRGQGAALATGHAYARQHDAQYTIHFDGDGQFDSGDIAKALTTMAAANADVLFGTRLADQRSNVPWSKKHILIPLGRLVHKKGYGIRLQDVHNGFRILSARALGQLAITQDRMAHATEIPARVTALGLPYIEFPVHVRYHEYGQTALGGGQILADLFWHRWLQ